MVWESLLLRGAHSITHPAPVQAPGSGASNCSCAEHVPGPSSSQVSGEGMQALKQTRPPGKSEGGREQAGLHGFESGTPGTRWGW